GDDGTGHGCTSRGVRTAFSESAAIYIDAVMVPSVRIAPLADLLRAAAGEEPHREAYVDGDTRASYGWLDRAADGFASVLLGHGVRPADRVGLLMPSTIEFAVGYFGAARVGAITSAANLRLGPAEQASIVGRTAPTVTVVGPGTAVPDG